jgi:hypothetical protein
MSLVIKAKAVAACILVAIAMAQESGIRVRSIRVLATDPEAVATFYKRAFGMSETRRPADTATSKRSSSIPARPLTRPGWPRLHRL